MTATKKITCSECGKRRVPAKRSRGRLSTKCNECSGGTFWKSEFGRWFADAAKRQSPDSMPHDERDIVGIHKLWVERKHARGWKMVEGKLVPKHDYHVCHLDAAKGDGYQGRFTTANLILALAKTNQKAKNLNPIDHGHRVYTDKKPFGSAAKVREWCVGHYNLNALVDELGLTKAKAKVVRGDVDETFLPKGTPPPLMWERQLSRYEGGSTSPFPPAVMPVGEAIYTSMVYGIGLGTGKLAEAPQLPSERPSLDKSREEEEEF